MSLDYPALIADLEAKRDALTAAIEALRGLAGESSNGPAPTHRRARTPQAALQDDERGREGQEGTQPIVSSPGGASGAVGGKNGPPPCEPAPVLRSKSYRPRDGPRQPAAARPRTLAAAIQDGSQEELESIWNGRDPLPGTGSTGMGSSLAGAGGELPQKRRRSLA